MFSKRLSYHILIQRWKCIVSSTVLILIFKSLNIIYKLLGAKLKLEQFISNLMRQFSYIYIYKVFHYKEIFGTKLGSRLYQVRSTADFIILSCGGHNCKKAKSYNIVWPFIYIYELIRNNIYQRLKEKKWCTWSMYKHPMLLILTYMM